MSTSLGRRGIAARMDWGLLAIVTALALLGIANLHSAAGARAGTPWHIAQSIWYGLGSLIVAAMALVDYRVFERWAYVAFGVVVALLVGVALVGTEVNGSQRWLNLGFFMMQPSELLKIAVVLVTARYFQDRDQSEPYNLRQLFRLLVTVGGAVFLVLQQPDLGTSLLILAIFATMVLFEGVRLRSLAIVVLVVAFSAPLLWQFGMHPYQKERVIALLNVDQGHHGNRWQVHQSMIAFGSGRLWGKGHSDSTQVQQGFVPEHETDFVAANLGEERGFAGMALLLGLYSLLLYWCLRVASLARDRFGVHIGVGVAALVFWHVLVNLGMVTGVLPVVGLTLPFLSYGGSSLVTTLMGIGLLLNVSIRGIQRG